MGRFPLSGNRIIETQPDHWRLIIPGLDETVLVEVSSGQPLRYIASFGLENNLPAEGLLAPEQIEEVALGWSREDQSWHLGLLFEATFADERGGRWCELAAWRDPESTLYTDYAAQVGQALAQTIARPFNFVAPGTNGSAPGNAYATIAHARPEQPAPQLAELPIRLGGWRLEYMQENTISSGQQLQFVRPARWKLNRLLRAAWYSLWAVIYVGLALITFGTSIAPARPAFLPYLALATATVLVGLVVYILYQFFTTPHSIIVEGEAQTIRAMRGNREQWRIVHDDLEAVYVTHTVNKKHIIQSGELNLLLRHGNFKFILEQSSIKGKPIDSGISDEERKHTRPEESLSELTRALAYSDLQAAGLYVAEALDTTCWYDRRVK